MTETATPEITDEDLWSDYIKGEHFRIIFADSIDGEQFAIVVQDSEFTDADREYVTDITDRRGVDNPMFTETFDAGCLAWSLSQAEKELWDYTLRGEIVTPPEVSLALRMSTQTLAKWRSQGKGPAFHKAGRSVRYRTSDVEAWLASQRKETAV